MAKYSKKAGEKVEKAFLTFTSFAVSKGILSHCTSYYSAVFCGQYSFMSRQLFEGCFYAHSLLPEVKRAGTLGWQV